MSMKFSLINGLVILARKYHGIKSPIHPKLVGFPLHLANFNEIFGKNRSKSLTISPENIPFINVNVKTEILVISRIHYKQNL